MKLKAVLFSILVAIFLFFSFASTSHALDLLFSDNFERGTLTGWLAGNAQISTDVAHSGKYSVKCTHSSTVILAKTLDESVMLGYKEIVIKYWWYTADTWTTGTGLKYARLRAPDQLLQLELWFSENLGHEPLGLGGYLYGSDVLSPKSIYADSQGFNRGTWMKIEIHYVYNDPGLTNGILEIKFNDVLKYRSTSVGFRRVENIAFNQFYLPSNIGTPSAGCINYIDDVEIWGGTGSDNAPSLSITSPTSQSTYTSNQQTVNLSGSASSNEGVESIAWTNSRGGSGNANNDSGDWTQWSVADIPLQEGENVITVTATDTAGQTATDTITVTYNAEGTTQVWNANEQTGDSDWDDSGATWCARVLIEGDSISQAGNEIMLGFQGRASGDYRIRKVSIAERDPDGGEGDVIDSTWTEVTFDGKDESTWATDVITVPSGSIKLSNPVSFNIQPGKDYYVTYLLESPSVYLIAPSYYQELYFEGSDHAEDIDWSSNGHSTYEARLHAIAAIYVTSSNSDTTPPGDVTNAAIEQGVGQLTLSWTNPSDSDFAGVMIRFRTDGTYPQNATDGQPVPNGNNGRITGAPGASGSYVHTGLDSSKIYYYSIFTYDTNGNYSSTAHVSASPLPANQAPSITSFTAQPNPAGNPMTTVTFSVRASDPDGDALTYTIDFGDNSPSVSGNTATHAYASKDTYTATATVSDGHGHSVSQTLQVTVNDNAPAKVTGVQVQ